MTRYRRIMRQQGRERFLTIGERRFTCERASFGTVLSEVLTSDGITCEVMPGYWRGQQRFGFSQLERAGVNRRLAMREHDEFRRRAFIRRWHQEIEASRLFERPQIDPIEQRYAAAAE